jgi:hypothetical protein
MRRAGADMAALYSKGAKVPRCVVDSSALQCHPMLGAML